MDLEARSLPPSVKAMLLAKLREYKNDLNNLKSGVKQITSANATQARDQLFESGLTDANMVPLSSLFMSLKYFALIFHSLGCSMLPIYLFIEYTY